ncbi:MAG: hypothetical protein IM504_16865 [Microcystis sp. M038S2]|uniref:hypothetical protein n=1 Tax=unclassified Microcystis TaxID=2643300 RepID=UPI002584A92F|nr:MULTISPECIES: hypothetical protein [unclassified Microcystis]MCA2640259.1 hypothetical protein [Microcystis sp. M087S2]MCA2706445.1 hypothetical protein [Microcystis sp. M038S2]MCA2764355.1 hypothetical protein [Microcystis sp. M151S2]MCA2690228.1 hypothetical protein [Microcystis sp. M037S2]MCA2734052.1 hypothetical protein [Microcystis sp. M158S2]
MLENDSQIIFYKTETWLRGNPDEKIFITRDERGFFTYTPHPTPHTLPPPKNFFSKPYLSKIWVKTPTDFPDRCCL